LLLASFVPYLTSGTELVRLRNALLYETTAATYDWTPRSLPAGFSVDQAAPVPLFSSVVSAQGLSKADDWSTALAVAGHLLDGGKRHSDPIQDALVPTYREIMQKGRGYCGDYADVFTAMARAAGVFSRSWAFSFDGFGGHGHIFNEVWDTRQGRWIALDVFNNQYFVDANGQPLSAIGLRTALQLGTPVRLARIRNDVRPGYVHQDMALDYYRRGLPEWYLWWGNAVQAQESAAASRFAAPLGRGAEQLAAIAAGTMPTIRVLQDAGNQAQRDALQGLRTRLLSSLVLVPLTAVLAVMWWGRRRAAIAAEAAAGEPALVPAQSHPSVLVLSSLFPSRTQPTAGIFIRERMFRLSGRMPIVVVAPQPWFPGQWVVRRFVPTYRSATAPHEVQQGIDVFFPRFLALPGIGRRFDGLSMALCAYPLVRRLAASRSVDVIDAHFAYPNGFAATLLGRWLGCPVTVTLRGTEIRHLQTRGLRSRALRAVREADRVFSVSDSLRRRFIQEGVPPEHIEVIGNGVDLGKFSRLPREEARNRLGIPQDAEVLVSVGGLVPRKGFHRVIECLPALCARHPNLFYVIVGGPSPEGDMGMELRDQVRRLDLEKRVVFTGPLPQDQIRLPLCAADVFVLATANEGWANVFLEAMACGLPVVTTDVGGNAEVVCEPYLGTVVPFGDAAALESAIEDALTRRWDRERIVAHARENTWDRRVAVLEARLREIVATPTEALA